MKTSNRLDDVKKLIKEYIKYANCGMFFSRNTAGDIMETIYDKDGITIDICYFWSYFEIFGLDYDEQKEIKEYYFNFPMEDIL